MKIINRASLAVINIVVLLMIFSNPAVSRLKGVEPGVATTQRANTLTGLKESVKEAGVTLTFECPAIFLSGKENIVQFTVHNDSDSRIEHLDEDPLNGLTFIVKRDGDLVPPTLLYSSLTSSINLYRSKADLVKGKDLQASVNFTRLFDLSITGHYEIIACWEGTSLDTKKPVKLKTAPVKPKVVE